jgi:hypothetical protein
LFSWGDGSVGQLGTNSLEQKTIPTKSLYFEGMKVTDVVCGAFHTLCATEKGDVYQLGQGRFEDDLRPNEPYSTHSDSQPLLSPTLVYNGDLASFSAANNTSVVILKNGRVLVSSELAKFEELPCTQGMKAVKAAISPSHFGIITGNNLSAQINVTNTNKIKENCTFGHWKNYLQMNLVKSLLKRTLPILH